jgi:hypothetical protein
MMGAKANAADCGEYAEVDPTGRYGRVRYHQPLLLLLLYHRFSIRYPCQPDR